jgi:hypothetical protein
MSAKPRNKVGATPAKLALVGVLALVLVGVVASNFSGGEAPPTAASSQDAVAPEAVEPTTAADPATAPSEAAPEPDAKNPFGKFAVEDRWPKTPLKDAARFDPFAPAPWAAVPEEVVDAEAAEDGAKKLDELRNAENAIIFMAGDTRRALIGEQEFQIGDVIGRFKIADITPLGVVLSEVDEGE